MKISNDYSLKDPYANRKKKVPKTQEQIEEEIRLVEERRLVEEKRLVEEMAFLTGATVKKPKASKKKKEKVVDPNKPKPEPKKKEPKPPKVPIEFEGHRSSSKLKEYVLQTFMDIGVCDSLKEEYPEIFKIFYTMFQSHPRKDKGVEKIVDIQIKLFDHINKNRPRISGDYQFWIIKDDGTSDSIAWTKCVKGVFTKPKKPKKSKKT